MIPAPERKVEEVRKTALAPVASSQAGGAPERNVEEVRKTALAPVASSQAGGAPERNVEEVRKTALAPVASSQAGRAPERNVEDVRKTALAPVASSQAGGAPERNVEDVRKTALAPVDVEDVRKTALAPVASSPEIKEEEVRMTVASSPEIKEEEVRMTVASSPEIKEEEVRLTVGASRAGKSSSPAGGAEERNAEEVRKTAEKVEEVVWKNLSKIFFILFTQYMCNAVFALLAQRVNPVAEALPRAFFSLPGLAAPTVALIVLLLLKRYRRHVKTAILLLSIEAPATSVTVASFNGSPFGETLLLSSIQLSVMLTCLVVYCRRASSQRSRFSVTATFIVSTIPALLALLVAELVAPTAFNVWLFSCAMTCWTNFCLLKETKRMIVGERISKVMPAAVHLHGFVLQGFLGQTAFLLFKPQE